MIRVEIEEIEGHGIYGYTMRGLAIEGRSRQPLLDACRQIKRMGGDTAQRAGLFRAGRQEPDISCTVAAGAALTVVETPKAGPYFARFRELPIGVRTEFESTRVPDDQQELV
jgi:hypothetical protein